MHEIRATLPAEHVDTAARLANEAGITSVAVSDVYFHGREEGRRKVVSVETSTPKARAFVDSLLGSPHLRDVDYSLTSRELRASVSGEDIPRPHQAHERPFPDVIQDLWQLSHLTVSYFARAAVGTALAFAAGVLVAAIQGGPIHFMAFKGPLASFAISAVIGITAGLSNSDNTGRRYLIGVAGCGPAGHRREAAGRRDASKSNSSARITVINCQ